MKTAIIEKPRLQGGMVVVVVLVGVLGSAVLLQRELSDEVGRRALAVARTVAQDDDVRTETGTLGASARRGAGARRRRDARGGEVSVGIDADVPRELVVRALPLLGGLTALALLLGLLASFWLNRRLRRLTLGIEPEELRRLLQGHEAVLNGSVGGVVAVDPSGVVVLANDEVSRLLGAPVPVEVAVADAGLPAQVARLLLEPEPEPRQTVVGRRALMASSRRVERDGRPMGSVLTLHGRTDVEQLTRRIDAVQAMSGGLRAHRHEAANRLHLLLGLLAGGQVDAAAEHLWAWYWGRRGCGGN